MKFKGTPGALEVKFVGPICIGIGTKPKHGLSQTTANSILPDTDEEYEKEKEEIVANMQLYAAAPELLESLQNLVFTASKLWDDAKGIKDTDTITVTHPIIEEAKSAINKALGGSESC